MKRVRNPKSVLWLLLIVTAAHAAEKTGVIRGDVVLDATGDPLHTATVTVIQLRRSVQTGDDGKFVITGIPPGRYDLLAHMHAFTDERRSVEVVPGGAAEIHFRLRIAPIRETVTVTASGQEETTLESFQSVTNLESLELTQKPATSLGDLLDGETGVAKRSSGPGTSRPVVRGFDGDRVLILQDGIRTGTLSSQSSDHGEPVDSNAIDEVEIVRGPATLLYGSNAIGGVVNIISSHHQIHEHPHEGVRGYLTGTGGTADRRGGGAGGFEIGRKDWLFWGDGGGQRSGDYATPSGIVPNSWGNIQQGMLGVGRFGEKYFFSSSYGFYEGEYGIPVDTRQQEPGRVFLHYRRHAGRVNFGVKNLGSIFEQFRLTVNYTDWNHKERGPEHGVESGPVVTHNEFINRQWVYRGVFDQKKLARWSGSLGFWGMRRDYKALGEEAITPPTIQNAFALFGLEQAQFHRFRLQWGGRFETNGYSPAGLKHRTFSGFSGAAGIQVPLWKGGAFVVNYSHSYRAPALEELYAFGPHAGNFTWEIGDANLRRERGEGLDVSLRHQSGKLHSECNFFYYDLADYVYLAPTGRINENLIEARYSQAATRYWGTETRATYNVVRSLWLKAGLDTVQAELKASGVPLPRIPPIRGRLGFEWLWKGFDFQPEFVAVNHQNRIFPTESPTAGYGLLNAKLSYTVTRQHALQMFSVNFYNATDRLYRNHLSIIKDFTPEIGRGVLFVYTIRFF